MSYEFGIEKVADALADFDPLARMHYAEMKARLEGEGHVVSDYDPQIEEYIRFNEMGYLTLFTVRDDGNPVGYAMVYVSEDMHNRDLVAKEDTLYIHPDHRNGLGKRFVQKILAALRDAGVKRVDVTVTTDPRVAMLWRRIGFKDTAPQMSYYLQEA